ncbi:Activating signal cointegrator 1 complex subunit 2, partial [Spiromyces aspiralis]
MIYILIKSIISSVKGCRDIDALGRFRQQLNDLVEDTVIDSGSTIVPLRNAPLLVDLEFLYGIRNLKFEPEEIEEMLMQPQDGDEKGKGAALAFELTSVLEVMNITIDQLMEMVPEVYRTGAPPASEAASNAYAEQISQARELLPDLGIGFITACLEYFKGDVEVVVTSLLEERLPPALASLDHSLASWPLPSLDYVSDSAEIIDGAHQDQDEVLVDRVLEERRTIFDNDEFDILRRDDVDSSRFRVAKPRQ